MESDYNDINWLSDDQYSNVAFKLRGVILKSFRLFQVDDTLPIRYRYGLKEEVLETMEEVIRR